MAKYTTDGNLIWVYGTSESELLGFNYTYPSTIIPTCVTIDSSDNIIVTIQTQAEDSGYITKYYSNGTMAWHTQIFPLSGSVGLSSVVVFNVNVPPFEPSFNYVVAGSFNGTIFFKESGNDITPNSDKGDGFEVFLNPIDGSVVDWHQYQLSSSDQGTLLASSNDHTHICTLDDFWPLGDDQCGGLTIVEDFGNEYCVSKSSSSDLRETNLSIDAAGNIIIAGYFHGDIFFDSITLTTSAKDGDYDIFLAKIGDNLIVPNVVGMTAANANTAITSVGLKPVNGGNEYSNAVVAGLVSSQIPAGSTVVATGSTVTYKVSLGNPTVPNIVGMTAAAANTAIINANLAVGTVTTAYSNTVVAGNVISQSPAAGTVVTTGSSVSYVVSLGKSLGKPTVPNIVGMTAAVANTAVVNANLVVGTVTTAYSNTVAAGNVISQTPVAGTKVATGSKVKYVISLGEKPIVPNIVGMAASDANTTIIDANLVVGTVTTKYSNTVVAGKVISQSPAAGKAVAIGSKVKYVISLGKK
jgi:beta-lactam-binding protein with PASTA domain